MRKEDYDKLTYSSLRKVESVQMRFHRYLFYQINWNNRLIGIKGARGVGKTTLILQHIKESFEDYSKVLYVSLDNLIFNSVSVVELVEYHYTHGGTHIFFDEVHRCRNWQTLMKNLYDDYPDLKVVYTGSSMLEIDVRSGDLSRRQRLYSLHGMSFREYLGYEQVMDVPPLSLEQLLSDATKLSCNINKDVKILPLFESYLLHGVYPFYKEEGDGFESRLSDTIREVLENDLPTVEDVTFSTIQKTKRMLMILAKSVPQTPKMNELYAQLDTNREQGLRMLNNLQRAGLLSLFSHETKSFKHLVKPDKIYLGNTNLMVALSSDANVGTLRETFFYHQLSEKHILTVPAQGDFLVDGTYLFEVGGCGKNFKQIQDIPNSYLAVDGIEYAVHNRIPLWLFGFLY